MAHILRVLIIVSYEYDQQFAEKTLKRARVWKVSEKFYSSVGGGVKEFNFYLKICHVTVVIKRLVSFSIVGGRKILQNGYKKSIESSFKIFQWANSIIIIINSFVERAFNS